ncbi:sensor domain-containing diguanylate cyclase [Lacticaseibacillus porcinae]|uniref:GGDEF domain-containing protein n=1 Tax=Lacticaseibacillus porcinae TaxID=1123687 RepID=UPI000F7A7331|nr:diguanylate cyclase [Lacticaseibacillus porcinae]
MGLKIGTVGVTAPLPAWLLLLQMMIVVLLATGFVSYYRRSWHYVFDTEQAGHTQARALRSGLLALVLVLGLGFHYAGSVMFTNGIMFHDIGLFLLTFTLMDRDADWWEFVARFGGILVIWLSHYGPDYSRWQFGVSLGLLIVAALVVWRYRDKIRYNPARHIGLFAYLGVAFWVFLPPVSLGIHLNWVIQLEGVLIYLAMAFATGFFMHARHVEDQRNRANAQLAHYDSLTDTLSASLYQQTAPRVFNATRIQQKSLTMAVIDIDHFKQVNDHYGHLTGDELLSGVAKLMSETMSQYAGKHSLYRAGGEEFNILFENMTDSLVETIVTAIWQAVRVAKLQAGRFEIPTTISIGVAKMLPTDDSVDDLYARADENLYQSKHNGRDAITIMGRTLHHDQAPRVMSIRTLLTQHVMDTQVAPAALVYDELILAKYVDAYDRWDFPDVVALPLLVQMNFLHQALKATAAPRIMINVLPEIFVSPHTPQRLADFCAQEPKLLILSVELTLLPDLETLDCVARLYHEHDLRIMLKNFAPDNDLTTFKPYLALIDGVKIRVNDLRNLYNTPQGPDQIAALQAACAAVNVDIVVNDIENSEDAAFAKHVIKTRYSQGYYFDRPALPRMS